MDNLIKTIDIDTHCLEIYYDQDALNPRSEDFTENLGTFCLKKNRDYATPWESDVDPENIKKFVERKNIISLPIKVFGMSCGIDLDTEHTENPDGFIYTTKEKLKKWKLDEKQGFDRLKHEVDIYNKWVNGKNYGYVLDDRLTGEREACFGFYDGEEKETIADFLKEFGVKNRYINKILAEV